MVRGVNVNYRKNHYCFKIGGLTVNESFIEGKYILFNNQYHLCRKK